MKSLAIAIGLALAVAPAWTVAGGRTGGQPPPPVVESVEPATGPYLASPGQEVPGPAQRGRQGRRTR